MYKIKQFNHHGMQTGSYTIVSEFEANELLFGLIYDEENGNTYELYESTPS